MRPAATSAVSFHCVRLHASDCDDAFALFLRGMFVPVTSLATGFAPSGVSQASASVLPFAVRVGGVCFRRVLLAVRDVSEFAWKLRLSCAYCRSASFLVLRAAIWLKCLRARSEPSTCLAVASL